MQPGDLDFGQMRKRLIELLLEFAFQYSDTPRFKLAHGGTSQFYFNCKRVTLEPEGQYLIGNLVFEAVRDLRTRVRTDSHSGAERSPTPPRLFHAQRLIVLSRLSSENAKNHGFADPICGP